MTTTPLPVTPPTQPTERRSRRGAWAVALAVPFGLLASGALVWQASYAAFSATTTNQGNSWETGSVALSDSQGGAGGVSGTALFDEGPLNQGQTGSRCITVSYTGDLAVSVVMAASTSGAGTLADDMQVTIRHGAGDQADCGDFAAAGVAPVLYTGSLTGATAGLGGQTPWTAGANATRTYRIDWAVDADAAEDQSATATFTWTATATS